MRVQGHAAGAWLTCRVVRSHLTTSSVQESRRLSIFSAIAGTLPDWDYLWYALQKRGVKYDSDFRHHTWITHTFPFYWIISGCLYLFGLATGRRGVKNRAILLSVATSTHLAQDMLGSGDGIMALYPLSKKMYGVGLSGRHGKEWNDHYLKTPYYRIEQVLIISASLLALADLFRKK